jgi:hypothetical protein
MFDHWVAPERGFAAAACLAGAGALGYAIHFAGGTLHPEAIVWLGVTLGLAVLALLSPRLSLVERHGDGPAILTAAGVLLFFVAIHLGATRSTYLAIPHPSARYWFAALLLLVGASFSPRLWLGRLHKPLMIAVALRLWFYFLETNAKPGIDVFVWQDIAWKAFVKGQNPFALTMPNIYSHTVWYGPGMADATHVYVGYPYPPLSLLLAGLGTSAVGDSRYVNLCAIILAAGLMALSRGGRLPVAAAALFLFTPRGLFVLEQAWTDSLSACAFALVIFSACRAPRFVPWAFGIMLAVKQYFVLCAPLALLLLPSPFRLKDALGFAWRAALIPLVTTLPFLLWNPKAFIDSVLLFQAKQPFRPDALSFMALTAKDGIPTWPQWFAAVLVLAAYVVSLVRAPRSPFGFALASAVVFLFFFAFAKQAFCNYYFFISAILCCAAASLAKPLVLTARSGRKQPSDDPVNLFGLREDKM